ncbi:hypothetical protein K1719_009403 [Acacia pycnantha]|nr:hypothetical protein K1719_009403 [Acacia pycnantha]
MRPRMTMALFLEIFVLSLLGVSLTLNMYFTSLRYTSPTFVASMLNTIASLTFIIAVILRLEVVDFRHPKGLAKVLGTSLSLGGGIVMSGMIFFIQLWCNEKKGPVFVTMFNPLATILVALLAYFVFGEKLYLGSIIGAVTIIVGLYLLLWGKGSDEHVHTHQQP